MELSKYIRPMPQEARQRLAHQCATSVGQLTNVAFSGRLCGVLLAVALEKATGGQVSRRDLRPDDWHLIWPELVGAECLARQAA